MYFRRKQSQGRIYLQIVESHRAGDQVRQRVIATLGRLDELEASGQLDRLLRSGARFARQAMVLDAARSCSGLHSSATGLAIIANFGSRSVRLSGRSGSCSVILGSRYLRRT